MKRKTPDNDNSTHTPCKRRTPASSRTRASHVPELTEHESETEELRTIETPSKLKRVILIDDDQEEEEEEEEVAIATPSKRPRSTAISTPTKGQVVVDSDGEHAPLLRDAARSARRKSARHLIDRAVVGEASDGEEQEEEADLAQRVWDEDDVDESTSAEEQDLMIDELDDLPPETPSKRGRGRKKGRRKERTPTPPRDMPPYEHYFFQNRAGGSKTSNNTLASLSLLSHEDYFDKIAAYKDSHEEDMSFLHSLHSRSFEQWTFELDQRFNLCLYGWGSKIPLLTSFASTLSSSPNPPKLIIINGYNPSLHPRDILNTIASTIPALTSTTQKLGAQPNDMLTTILHALSTHPPPKPTTLLVHSLDSPSLRRLTSQSLLARLAASPHIRLVASVDTPTFPLLWDTSLRAQFKWLFHDVTTFRSFDVELARAGGGGGVVDEVNMLLGRSGRKMQGREGVMYVLRSLTESARSLFALLIAELLSLDESDGIELRDEAEAPPDDEGFESALAPVSTLGEGKKKTVVNIGVGIDFRTLYQKAAAQFIATNEATFRGLLREFYDHEMLVSRKDALGGEVFGVPFRREEMEAILGELMGGES